MTDQADDIPTVVVTVHITADHQVANICPLELTCTTKTIIEWNFIGGSPEDYVVQINSDATDFKPPIVSGPSPLRILNSCTKNAVVPYQVGVNGKHLVDPSIDNQPNG